MADFCATCYPNILGRPAEENDLADPHREASIAFAICEGCGPGWFDRDGDRHAWALRGIAFWVPCWVPPQQLTLASMIARNFPKEEGWQEAECPSCGAETWMRPDVDAELLKVKRPDEVVYVCTLCMLKLGSGL